MTIDVTHDDTQAAALQYARKVTGFHSPSKANAEAFWSAVEEISRSTEKVLEKLVIGGRSS
jgi:hypothetical protein